MTTTKKELAALLIESDETGRELQWQVNHDGSWRGNSVFEEDYNYRLKPIIKYYRVWHWPNWEAGPLVSMRDEPFPPVAEWSAAKVDRGAIHLHDFEKEQ